METLYRDIYKAGKVEENDTCEICGNKNPEFTAILTYQTFYDPENNELICRECAERYVREHPKQFENEWRF